MIFGKLKSGEKMWIPTASGGCNLMAGWEAAPLVPIRRRLMCRPSPSDRMAIRPIGRYGQRDASADQYIPASVRSQSLGNVSPNVPAAATGDPREDLVPGPVIQGAGSLATDPEQRRRIIAGQLFPDLGPREAQFRVTYGSGGSSLRSVGMDRRSMLIRLSMRRHIKTAIAHTGKPVARAHGGLIGPSLPAAGGIGLRGRCWADFSRVRPVGGWGRRGYGRCPPTVPRSAARSRYSRAAGRSSHTPTVGPAPDGWRNCGSGEAMAALPFFASPRPTGLG